MKKLSLELGGKNSLIILDDADLDLAASNAAWGAFSHQGQICMTTGRILAQRNIIEALAERIVERAQKLPVGNPAQEEVALGPIINERQRDRVHSIVTDSVKAGAKLLTGGSFDRLFYQPTVLANVKPGMRAFEEEMFGPNRRPDGIRQRRRSRELGQPDRIRPFRRRAVEVDRPRLLDRQSPARGLGSRQ